MKVSTRFSLAEYSLYSGFVVLTLLQVMSLEMVTGPLFQALRLSRLMDANLEDHRDEDISTTDITIPPILIQGPITRSRARQLKQQVNSLLCFSSYENENRLLPNDVIVLRKLGEDLGQVGEHHGGGEALQGRPHQVGGLVQLNLEPTSASRNSVH